MQWEYHVAYHHGGDRSLETFAAALRVWLNEQARDGWELVGVSNQEGVGEMLYLKRLIS
jgi:histidinol phosphatase-like enzyme